MSSAGEQRGRRPADWQLPAGVNRGLWDYLSSAEIARAYDAELTGSPLCRVDQAFVARHCSPAGRLLDLGCGTGRLLLALAAKGHPVVGVDLSPEMLTVAAEKASAAGLPVDLIRANITDLGFLADSTMDCVACLFSTLGMVVGATQRQRVFREVVRLLRPGGRLILHVHNRWFNCWTLAGRVWLWQNFWHSLLGRAMPGDRVMPVHQGIAGLTLHLFTRREAVALLHASGLRVIEVKPIGLRPDGTLPWPRWFSGLRAYGYLLAAQK